MDWGFPASESLADRASHVPGWLNSQASDRAGPEHADLKDIARGCITRHHAEHYLGFFRTQWALFEQDRRLKPLLYTYRVLLTGLHLMETGTIEADLVVLAQHFGAAYLTDLIQQKVQGREDGQLRGADFDVHAERCRRLAGDLEAARNRSTLPEAPSARAALDDLLRRLRRVLD